jgi:hypothetical protein
MFIYHIYRHKKKKKTTVVFEMTFNIISVVVVWNWFLLMDLKTLNQVPVFVEFVIGKKIDLLNHHYYSKLNRDVI